jgi:hypothetical protein
MAAEAKASATTKHVVPCKDILDVKEWIDGNSKPGAKTRLAIVEKTLAEEISEIKSIITWTRNTLVGLVITIMASGIVYFIFQVVPHVNGQ